MKYELQYLAAKSIIAFAHDQYTGKSILIYLLILPHSRLVKRNASICVACLVFFSPHPELCCHHVLHSMSSLTVYLLLASAIQWLSHTGFMVPLVSSGSWKDRLLSSGMFA